MENTLYLLNLDSMNQFDEFSEKEQEKKCHGFNRTYQILLCLKK